VREFGTEVDGDGTYPSVCLLRSEV
jgi:hypothetical protein